MTQPLDWFVIPFAIGFWSMMLLLVVKICRWWLGFSSVDKKMALSRIFSVHTLRALVEMVREGLLHRNIFRVSPRLGYMHMSLAMGWFLLIVVGKFQTLAFTGNHVNAVWLPIFFKSFYPGDVHFAGSVVYEFLMDAALLLVLSGVALAWYKRAAPSALGMRKSARHIWPDRVALTFLWFVFPVRLLSEGVTAAIHGGGSFLTGTVGAVLSPWADLLAAWQVDGTLWWGYSIVLGGFFLMLPWSRYMHIPAELVLILFRHWGVSPQSLQPIELEACSRCGICIDGCAMLPAGNDGQAVYYVRDARYGYVTAAKAHDCLMCGSCESRCPVGLRLGSLRLEGRRKGASHWAVNPVESASVAVGANGGRVVYFPGCVGALTPAVTSAMRRLMQAAGVSFVEMDANNGMCCGRPLFLSGQADAARAQVAQNSQLLAASEAQVLVTSCPVCYKMFSQYYQLPITVMHHTQWLKQMVGDGRLQVSHSDAVMVYHDPCELGRGCGVYDEPRDVLSRMVTLQSSSDQRQASLCCGGSLGGYRMKDAGRQQIASHAVDRLVDARTQTLVTACPMCKKTLAAVSPVKVKDIAEVTLEHLVLLPIKKIPHQEKSLLVTKQELVGA
ncbi:MAG: (Fe-S)-binding protein [Marinilabiliaceae bacterium]|nr:(Fe-S)-binding protein [Marinilabiliaceae bacterium]